MPYMTINCPHCNTTLEIDEKAAGSIVTCPACHKGMQLAPLAVAIAQPAIVSQQAASLAPKQETSVAAMWSLVLGILSLLCLGLITGIPAIICGHISRKNIRNSDGVLQGSGMALAGLICGYVATVISIVMILFFALTSVALFGNTTKYIKVSRISAAKGQISNFDTGINAYLLENGKYPPALSELTRGNEPIMAAIPLDPWQNPYKYVYPSRHPPFKYDISSFGPDGIENSDDDITNWRESGKSIALDMHSTAVPMQPGPK